MRPQAEPGDKAYRVATVHTPILPSNGPAPPVVSESTVVGRAGRSCLTVGVSAVRKGVESATHALDSFRVQHSEASRQEGLRHDCEVVERGTWLP